MRIVAPYIWRYASRVHEKQRIRRSGIIDPMILLVLLGPKEDCPTPVTSQSQETVKHILIVRVVVPIRRHIVTLRLVIGPIVIIARRGHRHRLDQRAAEEQVEHLPHQRRRPQQVAGVRLTRT